MSTDILTLTRINVDLFQNVCEQHPILKEQLSSDELQFVREVFSKCAKKVMFILDGIDESKTPEQAFEFYDRSRQEYRESTFIVLTRPEGKEALARAKMVEFAINDFEPQQFPVFVNQFPFSGKDAQEKRSKRDLLMAELESNDVIKKVFPIPVYAVMICVLFNQEYEGFGKEKASAKLRPQSHERKKAEGTSFQSPLDIYKALLGMILKATEIRSLERKIANEKNQEKKDSLSKRKTQLLITSCLRVYEDKKDLLVKLGYAIFICNGNSLIGFQDLEEISLRHAMKRAGLNEVQIDFILKMSILEQKLDLTGQKSVFQITHRNLREILSSLYASQQRRLELQTTKGRLRDTHLAIFRCAMEIVRRDCGQSDIGERMMSILEHILGSCNSVDESI